MATATGAININGTVQSQQVLCCNARCWTRILAWIEIVLSSIGLLVFSIFFVAFIVALGYVEDGSKDAAELEKLGGARMIVAAAVVHLIIIGICLLNLAGGILLVQGVNQENPSKFYCWLIIQGICIGFTVLKTILILASGAYTAVTMELVSILIYLFCFWVVNLHRKELLTAVRTGRSTI